MSKGLNREGDDYCYNEVHLPFANSGFINGSFQRIDLVKLFVSDPGTLREVQVYGFRRHCLEVFASDSTDVNQSM